MPRPHPVAFLPPLITLVLCVGLVVLGGCHVGNFSASIDSDSKLPQFEFSAIPSQWEPTVDKNGVADGETDGRTGSQTDDQAGGAE